MPNRRLISKALAVLAAAAVVGACSSTPHVRAITITFVRHAESEANAEGLINTDVPGPGLTEQGRVQAEQGARQLARNGYDGVYASTMLRAQQTAAPLAHDLGKQVEILPGLREINAGWFNGTRTDRADLTYLLAPAGWLRGDRREAIPGSIDGTQFNNQFSAAVQKIYESGDKKPIAFSHGVAIAYWTLMNVKNPNDGLATKHPLPNMARVVITGSPTTGWRLVDWDGIRNFNF
ncbi:histidine phosphatase family protein [Mycobacterium sp.]|uniref:histidine phosphatase family protein n=1 Tax=Mycobacterium sp. TaxID=1785 RepID=UPI0031D6FBC7